MSLILHDIVFSNKTKTRMECRCPPTPPEPEVTGDSLKRVYGHGDLVPPYFGNHPRAVGCMQLMRRVIEVKPKLHFFGHVHCGYGVTLSDEVPTAFINCAVCDEGYRPVQAPIVVDI